MSLHEKGTDFSPRKIFVVIANWNGKKILRKCLESFFVNTVKPESQVVVVDNASIDGSIEMLEKEFPNVKLIKNAENLGFTKPANQGIRYALAHGAKHVLLLNNDIEISRKDWLTALVTLLESDPEIGIVGCKLLYPDGLIQHAGGVIKLSGAYHRGHLEKDSGKYDKVQMVDYVTGAALLIKSDVIRRIGLLDEGFSPLYCEDTDWCMRARFYGYKVVYTPNPVLIHHCGSSANTLKQEKVAFFFKKSWIRFFLLNFQLKHIIKRILMFESKEVVRCLIVRNSTGNLPIELRGDASRKLGFLAKAWAASLHDLKGIMSKRKQRMAAGITPRLSG